MPYPLNIKNLSKNFGETKAVQNLNLAVKKGEIFSLIGPNGSGKTTIIRSIVGLLFPTSGRININGISVSKRPEKAKAKLGYIPDQPEIWSSITGEEFLYLVGALYNMNKHQISERIPGLLDIFGLKGIEKNYFEDYSRGNKQKFTILAAFLHRPQLLLIDEPIVGLDPVSAETAQEQFQQFAKNGGSILMATHTLSVTENISHRIGVLKQGKLAYTGTPKELKKQAKLDQKSQLTEVYKQLTAL